MGGIPDCIYVNGQIITMDPARAEGEALATLDGRVLSVGGREEVLSMAGKKTRVLDLDGRTMLPGFIDPHSHFLYAGLYDAFLVNLKSPPVGSVKNIAGLVGKLREKAESAAESEWVTGYGYDDTLLEESRHPTAQDLDRASETHPILVMHVSGHIAALNSPALKICGIDENTPDPFGARIRKDESTGRPNGVLDGEPAMQLTDAKYPRTQAGQWLEAVRNASSMYAARGVTSAQEGDAKPGDLETLVSAHEKGVLSVRVQIYPNWDFSRRELSSYPGPVCGTAITPDRMLVCGGVKMYQDGSLQAYSGYLSRPYHKQLYMLDGGESYRGLPRNPPNVLNAKIEEAHRLGWQVAVHANGDQAIEEVIDAVENAQARRPRPDARHVIIHCQTVREDQLDRMCALGIVPSFFTTHTFFWGDRHWEIFLGPERAARIDPCGSAMLRGMPFTCHNDTYVTPIDPLLSVWSAVNRLSETGRVIGREFRVPVMEALRSVTSHAAFQGHQEDVKGALTAGKLADMTILEDNPLSVDPLAIKDIRVSATLVGDKVVYGAV